MVIVQLNGGLGNQLFQYAAAKTLAVQHGAELKLDISAFQIKNSRNFDLGKLGLSVPLASSEDISAFKAITTAQRIKARLTPYALKTFYKEPFFHFDPHFLRLSPNVYLQGYFQSEKYFASIQHTIRKDFDLARVMPDPIKEKANGLRQQNSVAIHLRRGDYKNSKSRSVHGILPIGYYEKAIEYFRQRQENFRLYLFSDDPVAAKEESILPKAEIVSGTITKTHFEDLYLMSQCRHNIIANSSFSWWAAWLNNHPGKIVIAPKNWFNQGPKDTQDLLPGTWVTL